MSLVLIPGPQRKGASVGGWLFDATTEEGFEQGVNVSSNPVSDGAFVSDHTTRKPRVITLSGITTATPLELVDQYHERLEDLFQQLDAIVRARQLVQVICGLGVFESMIITNASIKMSADAGFQQQISITLQEVRIARTRTVLVPKLVKKIPIDEGIEFTDAEADEIAAFAAGAEELQSITKDEFAVYDATDVSVATVQKVGFLNNPSKASAVDIANREIQFLTGSEDLNTGGLTGTANTLKKKAGRIQLYNSRGPLSIVTEGL